MQKLDNTKYQASKVFETTITSYRVTMSSSPRPQYFVAREDGTLTPLIAVDEMPSNIQIGGVAPTISPAGTQNMISLGLKERSSQCYKVSFLGPADHVATPSATNSSAGELRRSVGEADIPAPSVVKKGGVAGILSVENWRQGVKNDTANGDEAERPESNDAKVGDTLQEVQKEVDDAGPETESPPQAPKVIEAVPSLAAGAGAGTKGTIGRKVYCTHWIRWGECDYTQQGCLYKHEMPDEDGLHEIGIATYPRWYRIANPEKFGGFTEVPEWHRRPGPAPTDQLWRGGSQARSKPPQSWEEFRQNATVPRPSMGNQMPNMGAPTFIVSPYPGSFNPFAGGFIPQQQSLPRQQWNKAPVPRVVNMDPPFMKKSIADSEANKHNTGNTSTSNAQRPTESGDSAAQSANSTASPNQASKQTPRPISSTSPQTIPLADAGPKSTSDKPQTHSTILPQSENATSSGTVSLHEHDLTDNANLTKNHSQPVTKGNRSTEVTRNSSVSSMGLRADNAVNEAYRPLVPSPNLPQQNSNNGSVQQEKGYLKAETTQAPILHRRFFVPAGQPRYVANPVESPPTKPMRESGPAYKAPKGKKGGNRAEKMDIGSLVDL